MTRPRRLAIGAPCLFAALALFGATQPGAELLCDDCVDDDANGLIDCYDPDCWTDLASCGERFVAPAPPPTAECDATLELVELWRADGQQFTSLTAGDIDGDTVTEVVFTGLRIPPYRVVVLDGRDGSLEGTSVPLVSDFNFDGQATIADVDRDGTAEIFVGEPPRHGEVSIVRLEHDLSVTYTIADNVTRPTANQLQSDLAFADFDHDGNPEVYQLWLIHDPADGSVLVDLGDRSTWQTRNNSLAMDVLPDDWCAQCEGLELVTSTEVFAVDVETGAHERVSSYSEERPGSFAVVDWNGDGQLDIVTNSHVHAGPGGVAAEVFVWDPRTGLAITPVYLKLPGHGSASVPLVADFDGDTEPELAIMERDQVMLVLDNDLSVLRELEAPENSSWTSATSFDFDADGLPEIVHRGTAELRILDVLEDSVLASADCGTGTTTERPIIADINGDDDADIVASCSGDTIVAWTVLGSPAARRVMNQYQYYVVNVEDDLTIPCRQQHHAAAGLHASLNASLYQAPLFDQGRSPADVCNCPVPPMARLAEVEPGCPGDEIVLDASSSSGCTVGLSYRWVDDTGVVACDWSASPTCLVTPSRTTTYRLSVACEEHLPCVETAEIEVEVPTFSPLVADAGDDQVVGCAVLTGTAMGGDGSAGYDYRWEPAGDVADPDAAVTTTMTPGVYTLTVTDVANGCTAADTVAVLPGPVAPPQEPSAIDYLPTHAPLLIRWEDAERRERLHVSWHDVPEDGYHLHRGIIDALRATGYTHAPLACTLSLPWHAFEPEPGNAYFLATALNCEGAESSYGRSSLAAERPDTAAASGATCP